MSPPAVFAKALTVSPYVCAQFIRAGFNFYRCVISPLPAKALNNKAKRVHPAVLAFRLSKTIDLSL